MLVLLQVTRQIAVLNLTGYLLASPALLNQIFFLLENKNPAGADCDMNYQELLELI